MTVTAELAGMRADKIVAELGGVSRSAARALVDAGLVLVDGSAVPAARPLAVGAVLELPDTPEDVELEPDASVRFAVALEHPRVLVVDKPAGLVVHPGAGTAGGTLASGLIARYPELAELPTEARWGIVHRLDKDTSGLLLVARDAGAHSELQQALRERHVSRSYATLVAGAFDNATGTIEAPIGRDIANPTRMAVVQAGRPARTHYRRMATWAGHTLLAVDLDTGRTHQIRVHLRAIGHPVIGDVHYGRRGGDEDPGRTWLHARSLTFPIPGTATTESCRSALPGDLMQSLDVLGSPASGDPAVDSWGEGA